MDQRTVVSCRRPVPSGRTIQRSASFSPSVKAIHRPSGDHSGEKGTGVSTGSTGAQDAFYERTGRGGLIVGYAAASEHTFAEATTALAQVIANVRL